MSRAIPNYFFLDGRLYKKIKSVRSDDTVVAFCYQSESLEHLPYYHVQRRWKSAFSITAAAQLMRVSPSKIKEVYNLGLVDSLPEWSYHIDKNRYYQQIKCYINEEDMQELRQVIWDTLPKNRYGIPHNDLMPSETELEHLMQLKDNRQYIVNDDGIVKIFRSDDEV